SLSGIPTFRQLKQQCLKTAAFSRSHRAEHDSDQELSLRAGAANGIVRTVLFSIVYVAEFRADNEGTAQQEFHASTDNRCKPFRLLLKSDCGARVLHQKTDVLHHSATGNRKAMEIPRMSHAWLQPDG